MLRRQARDNWRFKGQYSWSHWWTRHPMCQSIADHRLYACHERVKKYMQLFKRFLFNNSESPPRKWRVSIGETLWYYDQKNATSCTTECFKLKELLVKKKYCVNPTQIGDNRRIMYKESTTDRIILHYHTPLPRQSDLRLTQRKLYLSEFFSQGRSFRWLQPNCYNNNNHTIFRYFNMLFLFIVEVINY